MWFAVLLAALCVLPVVVHASKARLRDGASILLVPLPWRSSLTPMRALAQELHSRALPVTLAVCEDVATPFERDGYKILRLPSCLPSSSLSASNSTSSESLSWNPVISSVFASPLPPTNWSSIQREALSGLSNQELLDSSDSDTASTSALQHIRERTYQSLLRYCLQYNPAQAAARNAALLPQSPPAPLPRLLMVVDRWAVAGSEAAAVAGIEWIQLHTRSLRGVSDVPLLAPIRSTVPLSSINSLNAEELEFRHLTERTASPLAGDGGSDEDDNTFADEWFEFRDTAVSDAAGILRLVHAYFPAFRNFVLDSSAAHFARIASVQGISRAGKSVSVNDAASLLAVLSDPAEQAAWIHALLQSHSQPPACPSTSSSQTATVADFDFDLNSTTDNADSVSRAAAAACSDSRSWFDIINQSVTSSSLSLSTEFLSLVRLHAQRLVNREKAHAKTLASGIDPCSIVRSSDAAVEEYVRRGRSTASFSPSHDAPTRPTSIDSDESDDTLLAPGSGTVQITATQSATSTSAAASIDERAVLSVAAARATLRALPWPLSSLEHFSVARWATSWFVSSAPISGTSATHNHQETVSSDPLIWSPSQCLSSSSPDQCLRSASAAWPLSASFGSTAALITAIDVAGSACKVDGVFAINRLCAEALSNTASVLSASSLVLGSDSTATAFVTSVREQIAADAELLSAPARATSLVAWSQSALAARRLQHLWRRYQLLARRLKRQFQSSRRRGQRTSILSSLLSAFGLSSSNSSFSFRKPSAILCASALPIELSRELPSSVLLTGPLLPSSLLASVNRSARCPQSPFSLSTGAFALTQSAGVASSRLVRWLNACQSAGLPVIYVQLDAFEREQTSEDAAQLGVETDELTSANQQWSKLTFKSLLQGLLHPDHAVLLVGSAAQRARLWPQQLPSSVRWLKSILPPSALIMRQPAVSLVVSTGSASIVHEALACAKPVFLLPATAEQRLLAARLRELGVSLSQRSRSVDTVMVAWATHILLHSPAVRTKSAELAIRLRSSGGTRTAADTIEVAFGLVRALYSTRNISGAASEVENEGGLAVSSSLLAPMPTPYRYMGYSFPAAAGLEASPQSGSASARYAAAVSALAAEFNVDNATLIANVPMTRAHQLVQGSAARYLLPSYDRHSYLLIMESIATPESVPELSDDDVAKMTIEQRSAIQQKRAQASTAAAENPNILLLPFDWAWYTRARLDIYAVLLMAFLFGTAMLHICCIGCGVIVSACKAELAK